jgi:hypothetical protein
MDCIDFRSLRASYIRHNVTSRFKQMHYLVLLISLIFVLNGFSTAQHRKVDEPISDELYKVVEGRNDSIQNELAKLGPHDWAGVYLAGDHHPTVFCVSPQNGFIVTSSLHTFSPSWVNFGKVSYSSGLLTIYPELSKTDKSAHVMPTEYAVIKWGDFRYLVPPSELINFAYDVRSGSETVLEEYFTRRSAADSNRKGMPDLPTEFQKYLRMPPIFAKVLSAKKVGDYSAGSIVIDAGKNKGVIPGMSFFLLGGKTNFITLSVSDVSETNAKCQVTSSGGGPNLPDNYWVRPKMRFSSRMPKGYAGWFR